ncbi:CCR4-NOT transcription complex subunit 1, partial [Tremellales sp. Uapishka_1]
MSIPPPGLGGGGARTGPPPGFGGGGLTGPSAGQGGTAAIVRAQIVFLLTTVTEDSFEKASADIRTLASTTGPEMYHHFVRRAVNVAGPVISTLVQHAKENPNDPPPPVPTNGQAALAWRLLVTEAVRASRDVTLAPHFSLIILSPTPSAPLPLPSMLMFNLSPSLLFSLVAFTLASPHIFPPSHPSNDVYHQILRQTFQPAMEILRSPHMPFWSMNAIPNQQPYAEDITLQEARTLILALFPRSNSPSAGSNTSSRPATPTNPTSPHMSPLISAQRATLLSCLTVKFSSPAIILQTLSALSPGGAPRSSGTIPLEDILFELGENLTQDEGTVEAVVGRWWGPWLLEGLSSEDASRKVTEEASRTILGLCEGLRDGRMVDVHGVVKGLCSIVSQTSGTTTDNQEAISFVDVIRSLDIPNSPAAYPSSLPLLMSLVLLPPQSPAPPIAGLLPASLSSPIWSNMSSLLAILANLTSLPPDALPILTMPNATSPEAFTRIVDPPSEAGTKAVRQQAKDVQAACLWNTMGLIQVLVSACAMAESEEGSREERAEIGRSATEMLDKAAALAPELVLIGLEKLSIPLPTPVANMHTRLLAVYLASASNTVTSSQLVFQQMWQVNPDGLLAVLNEFYGEDENNLGRVVEIGMDLKEYLNLEQWLADGVSVQGHDFLEGMFDFVEHKIRLEIDHQHQPESAPPLLFTLGTNVYSIFIRVVRNAEGLTQQDIFRFKNVRTDILILHPRLLNLHPTSKTEQGFSVVNFDNEVTSHVDNMFHGMYNGEVKLDDVVEELKRCQKSDDGRDHDIFACALHSLFDEYKFVKTYPPKELTMTGILFGAIIDYRLVKDTPAFVATRYVLDACKTAPHEALYTFGINALTVLRGSLVDFPGLCRSLLEIPALHESHPGLINEIVTALAEREDLDQQGGVKLAFPALKLPVLIEEGDDEFKTPDDKKKDAIMFIINNIAPNNFDAKSSELVSLFENQYSRWFAHYFIDLRVSSEQSRHDLYMQLMESIDSPVLDRHILWETYRKARDLLNSEATMTSAAERTTLKTVAMWLGRLTLAKNKPIKLRELSLKDLLIQGSDNSRMIVAIPFVCNLLLSCRDSVIFHVPNPWLVAILSLLVELYHFGKLRLNQKFEIEVLFGQLDVQLESMEPSNIFREHVPPAPPQPEVENRLDMELQRATAAMAAQQFSPPMNEAFARIQQLQTEQAAQVAQAVFMRRVDELVNQLPDKLVFSPEHPIFTAPTLKRIVHHSIDQAIREIITPVVERSVTIAGISSRDLVQKDFGMEGDAVKMRHSAHMMVQNLAGNLALVTCKEPLRTSMITNVRGMLGNNGFTEDTMPDVQIAGVVGDNLDVACAVVKKAAMEKAAKDIDVNLAPQYAARKAHRDSRNPQPFWDAASFGVTISQQVLPDPLRLRNGGLNQAQLRVYEDFGEPPRILTQPSGSVVNGESYLPSGYRDLGLNDNLMPPDVKRGPSPRYAQDMPEPSEASVSPQPLPAQTSLEKFHELVAQVEKVLSNAPVSTISAVPADHEIRTLIGAVVYVANQSLHREQTTLVISQKVVQLLYKCTSPLGREVYVLMLQQLCELVPKVNKEVKQWLIYAEDVRKFNVPVTSTLIRAGFISVSELDGQLAQMVTRSFAPEILDFVAQLIRETALSDRPSVPRNGFAASLAAFVKAAGLSRSTSSVDSLLEELRVSSSQEMSVQASSASSEDIKPVIDTKLQERLTHYFLEWVRVFSTSQSPETSFVPYVTFLQKEGILNGEDISSAFYRTSINCAVDLDAGKVSDTPLFYGTDSLAKLIVLIVKNYGDKSGTANVPRTVYYFNKIITIMSYSLVQRQLEMGESFDQRPWARFYTSMLSELSSIELSLPETYIGCLKSFANVLGITQPTYAPRFAFGWLSIISHRLFMPKLLQAPREDGWADYHRCIMWLLRFLSPFLKSSEMAPSSRSIFKGTLRILLVIMHDFPEFLVEFYHTLTTAIPVHCVQLRNIILSAFPHSEAPLPDYYKRLDQLIPEMQRFPTVRSDYIGALSNGNVKAAIDQFVRTGVPAQAAIVAELKNRIAVKSIVDGAPVITWNHTLLHATVFYLGTSCVARKAAQTGMAEFDHKAPEVAIVTNLVFSLDAEGQYYLLSVIADQLRYPSAHTLFFVSLMLYLFGTAARSETPNDIPERIGRVFLERVIVRRPHPWGLIVAFVELLDNEAYGFWKQPFVRAQEEIYALFGKAQQNFVGAQMQ